MSILLPLLFIIFDCGIQLLITCMASQSSQYIEYHIHGTFGGDFNLAVILIWRFGELGFNCQT